MPELAPINICTGCTACMSVCPKNCITMESDKEGFRYPKLNDKSQCINCGKCELVCPVKNKVEYPLPTAYAAYSNEDSLRSESSSGGVFSEFARYILNQSGVVYGAQYDDNFNVKHTRTDNEIGLSKLRGAKYSESDLGNTFADVLSDLKQGKKVLFSGTPCQVAGLKTFVKKDYENLYCIDFVCHGIPSPVAWNAYVEYRANCDSNGEKQIEINMRSKCSGWSRYKYSSVFKYKNGTEKIVSNADNLFMSLFVGGCISRPSCESCNFKGYGRTSDITIGDFWGIWDTDPEMDDDKGTSVVLVQSEKGQELMAAISDKLIAKEVELETTSRLNTSILVPSKSNKYRKAAFNRIRTGRIDTCGELLEMSNTPFINIIKGKIKKLIKR
ncbi:MAG: Coenzyme F420 hydrogenase/dehydrogenase, beta subunit C-terminal domain [Clostridia bacterium]|nr:Coenzyme F420 hydrogenase/dehydrogenase, beta subunit C-terminal domain [Clostridia bacterium]